MAGPSTRVRPPPPPPPRRAEFGWEQVEGEEQKQEEEQTAALTPKDQGGLIQERHDTTPPREYLLTVKSPCPPRQISPSYEGKTSTIHQRRRMDTVQIQVYPQMSADVLAQCVTQAVSQSSVDGRDLPSLLVVSRDCSLIRVSRLLSSNVSPFSRFGDNRVSLVSKIGYFIRFNIFSPYQIPPGKHTVQCGLQ